MRQLCEHTPCTNAAVAYIADIETDDVMPSSRFVCELHAPADVEIRR